MRQSVPQSQTFPWPICFVEDQSIVAQPIKTGLEVLLNARVDHFLTTTSALGTINQDPNRYKAFIFDNRTGSQHMKGIALAEKVREICPEAIVVSLNSSDLEEMLTFGVDKLNALGIQVFYKVTESGLIIPWLADCAKQNRMIGRVEWLQSIGEDASYYEAGERRKSDRSITTLCNMLTYGLSADQYRGILLRKETRQFIDELTAVSKKESSR